ncbi:hypothetical protein DXT88_03780 [Herbaspirillum lusitanum]|uniref:hypothetical protein n=1 Tax=Herbaspirillum lusitanum TaxID=213312 RepID=UPI00223877F7|nr:hypothetical protein [Herbaspirillum lusitanum]MCW5297287.1 hypothetical protein [Herbaspirillum lusitanum]
MKKENPQDLLTVTEKFRAAVRIRMSEQGLHSLSIAEVCRTAGINRANLYSSHPELISELRQAIGRNAEAKERKKKVHGNDDVTQKLKETEEKYQALLGVCIELNAEVIALRKKLELKIQK